MNITTPHIDEHWRDEFIVAMRAQDATGKEIGDALATVDAHCAESGESSEEAFGEATAYATSLARSRPAPLGLSFAVGILMGALGMLITPRAVNAWQTSTMLSVTVGDIIGLALTLGVASTLMVLPRRVLPWLAKARFTFVGLLLAGVFGVLVLAMLFLRDVVAELDWRVALVVGIGLLVASVVSTWRDLSTADPVTDPRTGKPPASRRQWRTAFLFPILTVLILVMDAGFRMAA